MKTKILSFILGVFTFLCIGAGVATSTDILTVKPAVPKSIFVRFYDDDYTEATNDIRDMSKKGYIYKESHRLGGQSNGKFIIVMEKY